MAQQALTSEEAQERRKHLMRAEADLAEQKALANQIGESKAKNWRTKRRPRKKPRKRQKLVLPARRQKLRHLRPSFAIFSRERSNFQSWLRRLKNWSGSGRWMQRITNISPHRSKRRASTRLWTRPKCPTLALSSGLLLLFWTPKSAIRLPWGWPAAG